MTTASRVACAALLCALAALTHPRPSPAAEPRRLWFYYPTNLQVDENVARLEPIWRRAAAAGYTHVMLTDSKFARLGELGSMEAVYFRNVGRVQQLANNLHLTIIPVLFSFGWSNNMLWHDPNLAEGLPVSNALFVVQVGQARLAADPAVTFGKPAWKDDCVALEGTVATLQDPAGNARFMYKFTLPRFRCYHVSVWVKTQDFRGTPEIKALADGQSLQFQNLGVRPTQDWTRHDVVFNTLEHEQVNVYFGLWGGARGRLQWKDWRIEEAGLVNVLRRPGAPVTVQGYVEGRDYERIVDPHLGNTPWAGEYQAWHEPQAIRTHLPDGTRLRVSWYHPAIIYDGAVMACPSEPETRDLLADEARRMRAAWQAPGYMMGHDEIRTLNWDAACVCRGLSAGGILADNVRTCATLLAGSGVYVWSDMFDPFHNAHTNYYLVRGDLAGSWEGLDRSVTIVNWNFGKRDESLKFFADRGHQQIIAGYYDGPVARVKEWLASAAKVPGVVGVMYTTWQNRYDDLEGFARACRE